MMKRLLTAIVVALATAGCGSASEASTLTLQQREAATFMWDGNLRPGQTLEIKGVNASIEAMPGSSATTARVEATRTARRSDPASVEIVVIEHANGVTICAVPPARSGEANRCAPGTEGRLNSRNNDVKVAFTVQVPSSADFVARTTNGRISTGALAGRVQAFSTNGNVEVDGGSEVIARTTNGSITFRSAGEGEARTTNGRIVAELREVSRTGEPLRFSSTNGSVTLRLPSTVSASIAARTSNGSIRSDIPLLLGTSSRRSLSGTLGGGGREIEMRTTNGGIRIEPI